MTAGPVTLLVVFLSVVAPIVLALVIVIRVRAVARRRPDPGTRPGGFPPST